VRQAATSVDSVLAVHHHNRHLPALPGPAGTGTCAGNGVPLPAALAGGGPGAVRAFPPTPHTAPASTPSYRPATPPTPCQPAPPTRSVRPEICGPGTPTSHHLQGEPRSEREDRSLDIPILPAQAEVSDHPVPAGPTLLANRGPAVGHRRSDRKLHLTGRPKSPYGYIDRRSLVSLHSDPPVIRRVYICAC
jgi:hypothetical protein